MDPSRVVVSARARAERFFARPAVARAATVALAVLMFAALAWMRVPRISSSFWLLGEQIRDWSIALGPWHDLPLVGTPSTVGGNSVGPVYYWFLWMVRTTIGPLFDNLPHAGSIGLALAQAGADIALFFALRRFTQSGTLAFATVLFIASGPYDMALTATLWNPPLSVALVKLALAMFLDNARHPSQWRMAATVAVAWLAVQAHSTAIFVFVPLAAWFVIREAAARRWWAALQTARLILEIVLVLQIPYLIDRLTSGGGAPTVALHSVGRVMDDPSAARPSAALFGLLDALTYLWVHPVIFPWINTVLAITAAGTLVTAWKRPWVLFATLAPVALMMLAFAGWKNPFSAYYFVTLAPAIALTLPAAIRAIPHVPIREAAALVVLAAVLAIQAPRLRAASDIHRLPEYEPLIRGTREILLRTLEIRDIFTEFELPPSTDKTFPYVCMGGRVTKAAAYNAFIARDGSVSFRSTRE